VLPRRPITGFLAFCAHADTGHAERGHAVAGTKAILMKSLRRTG
jgi:hypothetical protein